MVAGWFRRPAPPQERPDEAAVLRARLRETVVLVNRSADRLPDGVVPRVRAVEDALIELLDHVAATDGSQVSAQTSYSLAATIDDYLPTSLQAFLALSPAMAATGRTSTGRTYGEELQEQLRLLDGAVRDLALAVHSGDAERLATQGRFLDTKFSRSDLELA